GVLQRGFRNELVSSIDIFPTILAAAGARHPDIAVPGLNLLNYMESGSKIPRDAIFGESFSHDIADIEDPEASLLFRWSIQGKWKLLLTYDGEVNRYKTTHPREEKRPQLFDLIADPHEKNNLAGKHPRVVRRMVKMIDDWYLVENREVLKSFK
ncbi:MAG: hypothetical protein MKZ70_05610, partial [Opitutales bacterium]|nr:hypothetical protein [Opitutales bacterium]